MIYESTAVVRRIAIGERERERERKREREEVNSIKDRWIRDVCPCWMCHRTYAKLIGGKWRGALFVSVEKLLKNIQKHGLPTIVAHDHAVRSFMTHELSPREHRWWHNANIDGSVGSAMNSPLLSYTSSFTAADRVLWSSSSSAANLCDVQKTELHPGLLRAINVSSVRSAIIVPLR